MHRKLIEPSTVSTSVIGKECYITLLSIKMIPYDCPDFMTKSLKFASNENKLLVILVHTTQYDNVKI